MSKRPNLYGACYFCICTACSRRRCPFKNFEYKQCTACRKRFENRPRLDCDFFEHYIKTRRFRFRPASRESKHSGTYILFTDRSVLVGTWDKLDPLHKRLGGELKKMEFLDFIGGFDNGKH